MIGKPATYLHSARFFSMNSTTTLCSCFPAPLDPHGLAEADVHGFFGSDRAEVLQPPSRPQASVFRAKGTTGALQRLASLTPNVLNFLGRIPRCGWSGER